MDTAFSGAIAKLRGASDDEISTGGRGDLMTPNSSEAKKMLSSTPTPSYIFKDPQIQSTFRRLLLADETDDEISSEDLSDVDDTDLFRDDGLGKKPGKDIAQTAKPDDSAAAASLDPKLAALCLRSKDTSNLFGFGPKGCSSRRRNRKDKGASIGLGIKSKELKATGVSDKNNKEVAGVASSTPVVIEREGCRICGDDHQHIIRCPYLECVPPGSTVGPDYLVICDVCGFELLQPTAAHCWMCGKWGGRAVEASTVDERYRNHLEEFYIAEPIVYAEYIDLDNHTAQEPVRS